MCFLKLQCAEPFRPSDCPHISRHHLLDGKCKLQIQKARQSQHKCALSLVSDSGAHFISWTTLHLSKKLISPHLTLPLTGEPSHAVEAKLFVFNQALIPSESKTFLIMFLCCGAPRLCEKPKGLQIDLQHRSGPFHPPFLLVPLFASCSVLIGCHLTQTLFLRRTTGAVLLSKYHSSVGVVVTEGVGINRSKSVNSEIWLDFSQCNTCTFHPQ